MTQRLRALTLLMLLSCMTAWAQPALAARLASVEGEAGAQEVTEHDAFVLSDEADITVNYNITKRDAGCLVHVRISREVTPGRWLVVNNVLTTEKSVRGSRRLTLPAGNYRVEVVATQANYSVTVDN